MVNGIQAPWDSQSTRAAYTCSGVALMVIPAVTSAVMPPAYARGGADGSRRAPPRIYPPCPAPGIPVPRPGVPGDARPRDRAVRPTRPPSGRQDQVIAAIARSASARP
ncbi:hypothetical protein Lfu02_51330 [Longispora fulva]|nr:hypothetical protein Lfu02_51330 [Longispora fulva]